MSRSLRITAHARASRAIDKLAKAQRVRRRERLSTLRLDEERATLDGLATRSALHVESTNGKA